MIESKALFVLTYGLDVITAQSGDQKNGQIANTVFQLTAEPKTIAISINQQNFTHGLIHESGRFCISILDQDTPMELIGLFGFNTGKDTNKFAEVATTNAAGGSPVLQEHCLAYLECDLTQEVNLGSHTLFIGELSDAAVLKQGQPLTYAYYHEVKKGITPKNAPTYSGPEEKPTVGAPNPAAQKRYRCPICGYIYDPFVGDPECGIKPGTAFEELPPEWRCPICQEPKNNFLKE